MVMVVLGVVVLILVLLALDVRRVRRRARIACDRLVGEETARRERGSC